MRYLMILIAILVMGCTGNKETPKEVPKKMPPVRHGPHRPIMPKRRVIVCEHSDKPIVVAVIDTGFTYSQYTKNVKLCKFGHKDFTSLQEMFTPPGIKSPVPVDNHGHGTNIAGVIQDNAGEANYCIVVIKYYDPKAIDSNNLVNTINAIKYATNIGAKYINYSGGGIMFDKTEKQTVQKFLDKGGRFIAAAGNEKSDIQKLKYYPAMYDSRIVSVGSMEKDGHVANYSNYGKSISRWEYGTDVVGFGIKMSGTSQATAIATGKIIYQSECSK